MEVEFHRGQFIIYSDDQKVVLPSASVMVFAVDTKLMNKICDIISQDKLQQDMFEDIKISD